MAIVKQDMLDRVIALHDLYHAGKIPTLAQHEVHPPLDLGSRENYLYFTLPPCLNFQRSSPAMWKAALATWEDPETNYVFFPEKSTTVNIEKLRKDLLKHKLALQPNKHTEIWSRISKTLNDKYQADPRELFRQTQYCVTRTKNLLQITNKADFPYISGQKMANYWLYILSQYTDIKLRNMHKISIIPDTHVIQCSVHLGLVDEKATPEQVAAAWEELLQDSHLTPVEVHPVLWNWSRNNFLPSV